MKEAGWVPAILFRTAFVPRCFLDPVEPIVPTLPSSFPTSTPTTRLSRSSVFAGTFG